MTTTQSNTRSAWRAARLTWRLMTKAERRKGLVIAVINVFLSLLDTVALVGVMPLVTLIIEPGVVSTNPTIAAMYKFVGAPPFNEFIVIVALGAVALIALSCCLNLTMMVVVKRFRVSCQNRLARQLITMCVRAPFDWLVRQNSMTLAHNVFNDVIGWSNSGVQGIMSIIGDVSLLLLVAAVVFNASAWTGLVGILLVGALAGAVMLVVRPKIGTLANAHRVSKARSLTYASEFLGGIKDIKVSGREQAFVDVYEKSVDAYGSTISNMKLLQTIPPLGLQFLSQIAVILIALSLWAIGRSSGEIASEMALVLLVTARAVPATTRLSGEISGLWNVVPHIEGIHQLITELQPKIQWGGSAQLEEYARSFKGWRRIELQGVGYRYSTDRNIAVHDISLMLAPGRNYGIVGPTGAGKTTLVDLILGLLPPTEGEILIDNVELNPNRARGWQRSIGYVPQTPMIIDATLIENVALGIPLAEVDREHALHCLDQAYLTDVVKAIGLDGRLGERGNLLSGGQRQRVAIARALYDRPSILILDEATSALDTISERTIQEALDSLHGHVTTITIAHRLKTIERCDEIFVLQDGKIVDRGTYDVLLNKSPLFRQLASEFGEAGGKARSPSNAATLAP